MVLVWEGLDYALHEVLLGHSILACNDNLENPRKYDLVVNFKSDTVKVGEANNVFTDGDSEFVAFDFSDFSVFVARQMLQPDPESVHF